MLRRDSAETSLRRPPWDNGKNPQLPADLRQTFRWIEVGSRLHVDTVTLQGKLAVKIALKTPERKSFVRVLLEELDDFETAFKAITTTSTHGKSQATSQGKFLLSIIDVNGRLTCRIAEHRGPTIVGEVSIFKEMKNGNIWLWMRERLQSLLTLHKSGQQFNSGNSHPITTQPKPRAYKEVLLSGHSQEKSTRPNITWEYQNGQNTMIIEPSFTTIRRAELAKCVVASTVEKGWDKEELAEWIQSNWKLTVLPKMHYMSPFSWLIALQSEEEQKQVLTLKQELLGNVLKDIQPWSMEKGTMKKERWIQMPVSTDLKLSS
ncbi:hypothetical protein H6P81_018760 [Aristolochia fimbriata]|uniref:Uncharacterized protein n=1 Tax=Aristolochia fimbriata TaxID=158543 RepID=A0AAV7E553_ARIFI|nr:hypothetical protein H6P81_018760 [Aristolochia fimbriata]